MDAHACCSRLVLDPGLFSRHPHVHRLHDVSACMVSRSVIIFVFVFMLSPVLQLGGHCHVRQASGHSCSSWQRQGTPSDVNVVGFSYGGVLSGYGSLAMTHGLQQCNAMFMHFVAVGHFSLLMAHVPWAQGAFMHSCHGLLQMGTSCNPFALFGLW